jgi:hypothetical protein
MQTWEYKDRESTDRFRVFCNDKARARQTGNELTIISSHPCKDENTVPSDIYGMKEGESLALASSSPYHFKVVGRRLSQDCGAWTCPHKVTSDFRGGASPIPKDRCQQSSYGDASELTGQGEYTWSIGFSYQMVLLSSLLALFLPNVLAHSFSLVLRSMFGVLLLLSYRCTHSLSMDIVALRPIICGRCNYYI